MKEGWCYICSGSTLSVAGSLISLNSVKGSTLNQSENVLLVRREFSRKRVIGDGTVFIKVQGGEGGITKYDLYLELSSKGAFLEGEGTVFSKIITKCCQQDQRLVILNTEDGIKELAI